jgi:hypothetical protein
MAYIVLCLKHSLPSLYSCLRKTHLLNWDLYLNLGDIMFVVAEFLHLWAACTYRKNTS